MIASISTNSDHLYVHLPSRRQHQPVCLSNPHSAECKSWEIECRSVSLRQKIKATRLARLAFCVRKQNMGAELFASIVRSIVDFASASDAKPENRHKVLLPSALLPPSQQARLEAQSWNRSHFRIHPKLIMGHVGKGPAFSLSLEAFRADSYPRLYCSR